MGSSTKQIPTISLLHMSSLGIKLLIGYGYLKAKLYLCSQLFIDIFKRSITSILAKGLLYYFVLIYGVFGEPSVKIAPIFILLPRHSF